MKTLKVLFVAVLAVIFSMVSAEAGQKKANRNPLAYVVNIPSDVSDQSVVMEESAGDTWECQGLPVLSKYTYFSVSVAAPSLTKWNFGKAALSGIGNESSNGRIANLTGYLSFAPGVAYITFAGQYCRQKDTQNYNYDTQQWECVVDSEFTCYDVNYYIGGEMILTVEP